MRNRSGLFSGECLRVGAGRLLQHFERQFILRVHGDFLSKVESGDAALRSATASLVQSRNATLAIVRLWVSVFMMTRCQNGRVMVAWSV